MMAAMASATGVAGLPSVAQRRCNACKASTPKAIGSRSPGLRGQQLQSQSPLLELRAKPATYVRRTTRVQVKDSSGRFVAICLPFAAGRCDTAKIFGQPFCGRHCARNKCVVATCSWTLPEIIMLRRPVRQQPWWLHHQQTRPRASNGART